MRELPRTSFLHPSVWVCLPALYICLPFPPLSADSPSAVCMPVQRLSACSLSVTLCLLSFVYTACPPPAAVCLPKYVLSACYLSATHSIYVQNLSTVCCCCLHSVCCGLPCLYSAICLSILRVRWHALRLLPVLRLSANLVCVCLSALLLSSSLSCICLPTLLLSACPA